MISPAGLKLPLNSVLQRMARRASTFAPERVTLSVELADLRIVAASSDCWFDKVCDWYEWMVRGGRECGGGRMVGGSRGHLKVLELVVPNPRVFTQSLRVIGTSHVSYVWHMFVTRS